MPCELRVSRIAVLIGVSCHAACSTPDVVLSAFDSRVGVDGVARRRSPHDGVDLGPLVASAKILSSAAGIVDHIEMSYDTGDTSVVVRHHGWALNNPEETSMWTCYAHVETVQVEKGQLVARGDVLGTIGLFPASGGVRHVHWTLATNPACAFPMVMDPMKRTVGFFVSGRGYERTQLTLPIRKEDLE